MKNIIFLSILITFDFSVLAQTGPGGVGSSTSNILWLDANALNLSATDPVITWTDISGNDNHAAQGTSSKRPIYLTDEINGNSSVSFDGTDDVLDLTDHITSSAITIYTIYSSSSSSVEGVFTLEKHALMRGNNTAYSLSESPGYKHTVSKSNGSYSIIQFNTDASPSGSQIQVSNGGFTLTQTRNSLLNRGASAVGARITNAGSEGLYFDGAISELIVFNKQLNSAEIRILNSSLSSKYDLTTTTSNLFSYASTHNSDVIGVGQESDGSNTNARGKDSLLINNPSALNDGDYLIVGNNNLGFGTNMSVGTGIVERLDQVWRADVTGTPGTVDLEFFLGVDDFSAADQYVLLIENVDGDFSNGGTRIHETGRLYSSSPSPSVKFTNVSLSDGEYFTIAEKELGIRSIKSGVWGDTDTWSCTCIPTNTDLVSVESPHIVSVNSNAEVLNLTIATGATISFDATDTLKIFDKFQINGTFTPGNGTVSAQGTLGTALSFTNNSSSLVALNNLHVSSTNGLDLLGDGWTISNNLQVISGGMDVSAADSVLLLSSATKTSQILSSMSGAFTGDFIVQRHISARSSNFANISSPITNATFSDLDDDLPISGAGGNDGNAAATGGGIFYSLYKFNTFTDKHDTITNIGEKMVTSRGYEIYLMSTVSNFNAKTVDFVGVPNSGLVKAKYTNIITQGWNIIGNPYHSYVSWDLVKTHSNIPNLYPTYYIFNTDNGSYQQLNNVSDPIAPSQAFWIYQPNSGGYYHEFSEDSKVNSNSPTFLRKKQTEPYFKLKIISLSNSFSNELIFSFNALSSSGMDNFDIPNLPSPVRSAPSITSNAVNSTEDLIFNSLNPSDESQTIPISVKSRVNGMYELKSENLEVLYNNYDCAFLKDKTTNKIIDVLVESTYSFEGKKDKDNRFELILSNDYNQCQKLLEKEDEIQKINSKFNLRSVKNEWLLDYNLNEENNKMIISVFNLSGQEVIPQIQLTANGAGSYPINEIRNLKGIYVVRVVSNDGILNKTVKL